MARYTLVELSRKRLVHAALAGSGVFLGLVWLILATAHLSGPRTSFLGRDAEASAGILVAVFFCYGLVAMFAAFSMASSLGAQLESGVLAPVVGRPVSRAPLLLGIWVAHAIVDALYALVLLVGVLIMIHIRYGYPPVTWGLAGGVGLMVGEAWAVSAVTMVGLMVLSPMAAGISVVALFFLCFLAGMFAQIDKSPAIDGREPVLLTINVVANLVMPTDGLYRRALWEMTGGPSSVLGLLGANPIGAAVVLGNTFLAYAGIYIAGVVAAASWIWRRRDI
jgi:ABC-type transport system involved in multi-copper enzyme maturation permease subunit